MRIKIIVADGNRLNGEILCCLLESAPGIEVGALVRDFLSLQQALDQAKTDVMIIDTQLPGLRCPHRLASLEGMGVPIILLSPSLKRGTADVSPPPGSGIADILPKRLSSAQEMASLREALTLRIREKATPRRILEQVA